MMCIELAKGSDGIGSALAPRALLLSGVNGRWQRLFVTAVGGQAPVSEYSSVGILACIQL